MENRILGFVIVALVLGLGGGYAVGAHNVNAQKQRADSAVMAKDKLESAAMKKDDEAKAMAKQEEADAMKKEEATKAASTTGDAMAHDADTTTAAAQ